VDRDANPQRKQGKDNELGPNIGWENMQIRRILLDI